MMSINKHVENGSTARKKVTAGSHFQSLSLCIKGKLGITEILTAHFGEKKMAILILHKAVLKHTRVEFGPISCQLISTKSMNI